MQTLANRIVLVAAALALFSACKPPQLDTKKAENILTDAMKAKGVTLTTVTCPSGIQLKTGTTFQCTAKDDQGTTGIFDMTVKDNTGDVAWQLEGKYMDMKVFGDSLEANISKRANGQPVDVTCPSKNILIAKGASFTCDVKVGTKAGKIVLSVTSNEGAIDFKFID